MIKNLGFGSLVNMDDLFKLSDKDHNKEISFDEFIDLMNKEICNVDGE